MSKKLEKELLYGRGIAPLNEARINRIMEHRKEGFIILSAMRSKIERDAWEEDVCDLTNDFNKEQKQNPSLSKENYLNKRNKIMDKMLEQDIQNYKLSYTPTYGGYKEGNEDIFEKSYIVYARNRSGEVIPFENLYNFALKACAKYNQDSVYIQQPEKDGNIIPPFYVNYKGEQKNTTSSNDVKINQDNEPYFTTNKRKKTNPQHFSTDIVFENKYVDVRFGQITTRMKAEAMGIIIL